MKTILLAVLIGLTLQLKLSAQKKSTVAVFNADTKDIVLQPSQVVNLVRMELEKTNHYEVTDKYDMEEILHRSSIKEEECFGKQCLIEAGKSLKVDKVLTTAVENYGEKLIITLRLLDIKTETIEKSSVNEFLNIQPELQAMLEISLKKLLNIETDARLEENLVKKNSYENAVRNPGKNKITNNGPRMGIAYFTGEKAQRLQDSESNGGNEAFPFLSQFGYQHEVQYLNEGNFQAVFEMLGMVSGIYQGMFIPSITLMNGFRDASSGFEFGFGPNFGIVKKARGYYDENDNWHLAKEWNEKTENGQLKPIPDTKKRLDSRGMPEISTGFIWAIGKTFKSGALNIPVNVYTIPSREGWVIGASMGFNVKK